jgi:hypothetical protein
MLNSEEPNFDSLIFAFLQPQRGLALGLMVLGQRDYALKIDYRNYKIGLILRYP